MVRPMKHLPSFLAHGEESTGELSLTRRSFLTGAAIAGLGITQEIRTLFEEETSEKTVIRPAAELPHVPHIVTEHVPTMEECEGSTLALGQRFALTRETENGKIESVTSAIEGDGLNIRINQRMFRIAIIHEKEKKPVKDGKEKESTDDVREMQFTANNIKNLLGETCVSDVSIQQGVVLHSEYGDLQIEKPSFEKITWGLRDRKQGAGVLTFHEISYTLTTRGFMAKMAVGDSRKSACSVTFIELPGMPSSRELASSND